MATIDYRTLIENLGPLLGTVAGASGNADILKFYEKNKALINILAGLGAQFIPGPKLAVPTDEDGKPTVNLPPSAPAPPPTGPPTPLEEARRVFSLQVKYFFIERKNTPWKKGGGRFIIGKPQFDAVLSGSDPLQAGDRIHIDITPHDQFGKPFQPGEAANNLLLRPDGYPAMEHRISGGIGELTNEYDDYGCTPVILIPWEGIQPGFQGVVGYSAAFSGITSNALPDLRIRPWGA